MRKLIIAATLIFSIVWIIWRNYSKNRQDYIITDFSRPQHFKFITEGGSYERVYITIVGKFEGTVKMAFFYGGKSQPYNIEDLTTMTFKDSVRIEWPYEEGEGVKHEFFLIPSDVKNGKLVIKVRSPDSMFFNK